MNLYRLVLLSGVTFVSHASNVFAQPESIPDGKLVYTQMCASCHGLQGEGVGNGAFPPLNNSEWLKGSQNGAQRIAQVLLHGLTGPIKVKGNTYNLVMPVQGALSDEQKVAVIRYVRKSFAGEETEFSLKDLEAEKEKFKNKTDAWTATELLKHYPIPKEQSPISNLIMNVYHGKWNKMPDFSKLEAVAEEEEHDGYISLKNINRKDHFGLVWQGDLEVPKDGIYEFELLSDDGSAVEINGKKIAEVVGVGAMTPKRVAKGKLKLTKGSHKLKVSYFEYERDQAISLKWRLEKTKDWQSLSENVKKKKKPVAPVIDLTPKGDRTQMYLNFIAGSTHRTMGVGYPHGHNIAFSLSDCQPDLIWKGKFISAGKHWTGRGQGAQKPMSNNVVKLGQGMAWYENGKQLELKLVGYTMDETGNPTFTYRSKGKNLSFSEKYVASADTLTRNITIDSDSQQTLQLRLAKGNIAITEVGVVTEELTIVADGAQKVADSAMQPVKLNKGKNTFHISYTWKK